ncbi:MAG TPA: YlmH/Sll1252 family protein [Candidatus Bathyarchaeia archaeon]|nr:YlmH/Sll1252 family protein [Candidatus Bathyarchaeia archaeon]
MSIFHHFRKEELPFAERALEMLTQVERKQAMRLTDFLDPRQYFILHSLQSQVSGVVVTANGGYDGAERVRAMLHPEYIETDQEDFQLVLVQIQGDQRFLKLEHRDVMGALLHVGLKREKFGDILMGDNGCQVILAKETADFVRMQVTQIHRIPVVLEEVPLTQIVSPTQKQTEKMITVSSPRIDAVVGEVYHLSRAKALVPIRAGRLKINWKVEDDPSAQVKAGDIVSLAGHGRFQVLELTGPTRSGRIRMQVGIFT